MANAPVDNNHTLTSLHAFVAPNVLNNKTKRTTQTEDGIKHKESSRHIFFNFSTFKLQVSSFLTRNFYFYNKYISLDNLI